MRAAVVEHAREIAEERLGELPRRLAHVRGVAGAANRMRANFDTKTGDCLVAAAWLHDVGYAPSVRVTGFHPLDGAWFTRAQGFDELVVSLVAFHTGAVAEARERGIYDLSSFNAVDGDILDALTFCDLTTGPDGCAVSAEERLDEVLRRYGPDDPVHRAVNSCRDDLLAAVKRVESWG